MSDIRNDRVIQQISNYTVGLGGLELGTRSHLESFTAMALEFLLS